MAAEDDLQQSLKDLNELFKTLNSTVKTNSERMAEHQARIKANREALEDFAKQVKAGTKTVKEYEEKKAAYEQDAARRARDLAQQQIEAEKQTKTFGHRLMMSAGASVESQKALLVWGGRLKATGDQLANIGGAFGKFGADLAQGNTKFTTLNPIVDAVTNAFGKMAEAIPYAGNLISGAMKLAAEGAKFMLQQLQTATESFQELSEVGALTERGMSGVQQQFLQSGMSLVGFRKVVTDSAQSLARFGGTVGRGAEDFSRIVGEILDSEVGDQLRRLGFTADSFGETTANFLAMQNRLGLTQGKTNQQLAQSAAAYAQELDGLARLTGQSRQAAQKQIDAALSEARFRSTIEKMNAAGQTTQAKTLTFFQNQVSSINDELGQAIRDISSGIFDSDAVLKFVKAGVDLSSIVEGVKSGNLSAQQAAVALQQQIGAVRDQQIEFAQVIKQSESPFFDLAKALNFFRAEVTNTGEIVRKDQESLTSGTDNLTNQTVSAQKSMEQMGRQLNNLAFTILPNFASVISSFTGFLRKSLQAMGVELPTAAAGGGVPGAPGGGVPGAPGGGVPGAAGAGYYMGDLRLKSREAIAGGETSPLLVALAKQIQDTLGTNLLYFSALNDTYERGPNSKHGQGKALDFVLRDPSQSAAVADTVASILGGRGKVIDEYLNPSRSATGGHIHAELYRAGGIAVGPKSGYTATLHGTEAVVPLSSGKNIPVEMTDFTNSIGQQSSMLSAQLVKLEELVSAMRDSNSISSKILQATNNLT